MGGTIINLVREHTRCRKLDDLLVGEMRDIVIILLGAWRNWAGGEQGLIASNFFVTLTLGNPFLPMKTLVGHPPSFA